MATAASQPKMFHFQLKENSLAYLRKYIFRDSNPQNLVTRTSSHDDNLACCPFRTCSPSFKYISTDYIASNFILLILETTIKQRYLSREAKASCDTAHCSRNKMIQVAIGWCGQLQGSKADVIQSFIIDAVCFIGVFN